jgi:hypothetical protein
MIAFYDGTIHFPNALYTLMRVGVVTDHIAQANKVRAPALVRVR